MKSFLRAAAATGVAAATISGVLPGTALAATPQDSETKPAVVAGTNGEFWGMTKSPGHTDFIQYDSYDAAVEASRSLAFPVGDWGRIRYDSTTCYGLWGNTSLLIGNNSCSSDSSLVRLDAHGELEVKSAPGLHLDGFSEYGGPQAHFGSGEDRYYFASSALHAEIADVDIEAGTATLKDGRAPKDATDVEVTYTDKNNRSQTLNARVTDGSWTKQLKDLALGKTTAHLEAFNGGDLIAESDVTVDLHVAPLVAEGHFDAEVTEVAKITGTATPNTVISARRADKQVATTMSNDEGAFILPINPSNTPGTYDLQVSQMIRGEQQTPIEVILDYGAGVTITSPAPDFVLDPGADLVVRGTAQRNSKIKVYEAGKPTEPLAELVAGTSDTYRAVIQNLEDREYKLVVAGISKGYNTTTAEVTVNPGTSSVVTPTATASFDADVSKKATVSGTGAANATITVKTGSKTLGSTTVDEQGEWSLAVDPIGAGKHTLTIEQTGMEGTQTITTEADFGDGVAISGPTGAVTPGRTTVTGTTQSGARVSVVSGDQTVEATVDGTSWTAEIEIAPATAPVTITAKQQSKGALHTEASTQVTTTGAQEARPVTINSPTSGTYKPGQSTTVSGTATPYAKIAIKNQWGATLATPTANVDGDWSFNRTYGPSAVYKLTAVQTRLDNSTSTSAEFTLSPENAFKKLTLSTPESTSTYTPGKNVLFQGTATPGATITAKSSWGSTLFTTRANQTDGTWAATRGFGPSATYVITLTQTALDGTTDSISPIILKPVAHQDVTLTSPTQGEGYTAGKPVTFSGTATPGAAIAIKSQYSGATLTTATANDDGNWSVKRTFGPTAIYNLDIIATDADGTTSSTELLGFGPATQ